MKKFFGTFGQSHVVADPKTGEAIAAKDYYVEIEAEDEGQARTIMNAYYPQWSMMYDESRWDDSYFPKGCLKKYRIKNGTEQ